MPKLPDLSGKPIPRATASALQVWCPDVAVAAEMRRLIRKRGGSQRLYCALRNILLEVHDAK